LRSVPWLGELWALRGQGNPVESPYTNPMASAETFVDMARRSLGITERPVNRNPFAKIAGHADGYPWCASFCVAMARQVGLRLPSESAYTPTMADGFKRAGLFTQKPQPGDIAFIDFPGDNKTRIQHVAIVERVVGDAIATVEGNTSSGTRGSQDNGGGVYERMRPMSIVVGYGRPPFDTHVEPQDDKEAEMGAVVPRPQGGYIVLTNEGGVWPFDGAPHLGSVPKLGNVKLGGNIVGGAWTESGQGYWMVARDGAVYAFGDAVYAGGFNQESAETRGGRYVVGMVRTGARSYRVIAFDPSDATKYDGYDYRA
jgi:CHAP domain